MAAFHILVADDFDRWRRFVCLTLKKRPELQVICEVSDGLAAVKKAEELQPDLILLDIGLPTMNGLEAVRRIRKVAPESKILILSQEYSADIVREALSLGALGYVAKVHAGNELLPAVEAVLLGKRFVGSGVMGHEFGDGTDVQAPYRHEIFFCSDDVVLLESFTRVVTSALNAGNAAIIVATEPHRDSLL